MLDAPGAEPRGAGPRPFGSPSPGAIHATDAGGPGHPLLLHPGRLRLLLQLLAAPDPPEGESLADIRALLPGAEVRRHRARGGSPPGRLADEGRRVRPV